MEKIIKPDHEIRKKWTERTRAFFFFFLAHPLIILFLAYLFFVFFIPPKEFRFMKSAERAFQQAKTDSILIKDITDFEWEKVCYINKYTNLEDLEPDLNANEIKKQGNFHRHWPFFSGAFLFISNGKIVTELDYFTWGIRITKNGLEPMHLNITGEHYAYLTEYSFKGDICKDRSNASFSKVIWMAKDHTTRLILFTDKGDE